MPELLRGQCVRILLRERASQFKSDMAGKSHKDRNPLTEQDAVPSSSATDLRLIRELESARLRLQPLLVQADYPGSLHEEIYGIYDLYPPPGTSGRSLSTVISALLPSSLAIDWASLFRTLGSCALHRSRSGIEDGHRSLLAGGRASCSEACSFPISVPCQLTGRPTSCLHIHQDIGPG